MRPATTTRTMRTEPLIMTMLTTTRRTGNGAPKAQARSRTGTSQRPWSRLPGLPASTIVSRSAARDTSAWCGQRDLEWETGRRRCMLARPTRVRPLRA